jgi:hypothetical protein
MQWIARLWWSHFFLLAWCGLAGADDGLFDGDEVLDVELRGPLQDTVRDKREPTERPFVIAVNGEEWPVAVRARGKSRLVFCHFPPLRLNFGAGAIDTGPFAGLGKVKLVTHCRDGDSNLDNMLEEYAAYRMLNAVTELSHRVRLLRIRYTDTDRPRGKAIVSYAFAIEPLDRVAQRNGAEVTALKHLVEARVNRPQAGLVFVFNYLIANLDWSLVKADADDECCHNTKVLEADGELLLVPYDFDLSGFVNARYARRAPNLSKRPGRKREYAGYCLEGLDLDAAVEAVAGRRAEIMKVIEELDWANQKDEAKRIEFLEAFFAEVEAGGLGQRLAGDCVG